MEQQIAEDITKNHARRLLRISLKVPYDSFVVFILMYLCFETNYPYKEVLGAFIIEQSFHDTDPETKGIINRSFETIYAIISGTLENSHENKSVISRYIHDARNLAERLRMLALPGGMIDLEEMNAFAMSLLIRKSQLLFSAACQIAVSDPGKHTVSGSGTL